MTQTQSVFPLRGAKSEGSAGSSGVSELPAEGPRGRTSGLRSLHPGVGQAQGSRLPQSTWAHRRSACPAWVAQAVLDVEPASLV